MSRRGRRAAVVLAGGRGTRMGGLVRDVPKPLLPVAGRPLITYQLERLAAADVTDVVVATGYLADAFPAALGDGSAYGVTLRLVVEDRPLGTGGGLRRALDAAGLGSGDTVVVVNGDLLSGHDLGSQLAAFEQDRSQRGAVATLHVRRVDDARPYGLVETGPDGRIHSFREKPSTPCAGLINAGTYVVDPSLLSEVDPGTVSSLERDVLPAAIARGAVLTAHRQDSDFLDVGTPEALQQAESSPLVRARAGHDRGV
ncbi:NDP-sugar synthase [Luteipulveratus sp. YIM 133132]|uniref:nucleotidyltransferase family protein n=1 Tax=Luteipulveratus flavus TaxID=3031728 RepID=UPI0023B087FE|nr:NDP-sugar synthase [Luteipulveratus sp. YIM 133132]MDE9365995.1 NDP-sugar synthase [Luteipulveratus sp. YIM 133132]